MNSHIAKLAKSVAGKAIAPVALPRNQRRLDHTASLTARVNAAQRAAESMQPAERRLLDDPYSKHFAGRCKPLLGTPLIARTAIALLDRYLGGLHAHIVLRTRYADDALGHAVTKGVDQIVLLGAGFDTTSLRAPLHKIRATIFEVDAPTTQAVKRQIIQRAELPARAQIRWVAADFERNEWSERLRHAGFDAHRPSLIIWLGVSVYLTPTAFERTLVDLTALCAPGSFVVFDYGDPEIVTGNHKLGSARRATRAVRRRGEPYQTGFTEPELTQALHLHGFSVRDHVRVPDLAKRYVIATTTPYSTDDWLGIITAERIQARPSGSDDRLGRNIS